ncbi:MULTISPECIES: glycosyltransferase [Pseudomonas]|nr:glycosyltransferase [Pseudomonas putida]AYN12152.1 glycosyl transferase [Pseudomonas putida]PTV64953.1 glycosyl transferase [Pseudomonas putida]
MPSSAPNSRPHVAVLMAAYNGVEWLFEQVESILQQKHVDVTIYASVDRSDDGTHEWLVEYGQRNPALRVLPSGVFGGAGKNFFRLLRDVDVSSYDYVAFSDQDDIWHSDKLITAHEIIRSGVADAYSANVTAFWSGGRKKLINKAFAQKRYDYFFEAAGPGCTYVLRRCLAQDFQRFIKSHWQSVNAVALHDWLIYAWARSSGWVWFIDARPKLDYRQHATNQMGANSGLKPILKRLNLVREGWYRGEVEKIAALLQAEREASPDRPEIDISNRWFLLRNIGQTRRNPKDRLVFLIMLLLNIY